MYDLGWTTEPSNGLITFIKKSRTITFFLSGDVSYHCKNGPSLYWDHEDDKIACINITEEGDLNHNVVNKSPLRGYLLATELTKIFKDIDYKNLLEE